MQLLVAIVRENMPMAERDNTTSLADKRSFRDVFGGFLFYVGIPATTLYPLGFLALSLQLWRDPDFPYTWASSGFNFAMLWYAVSLVPKVVVIGTGIRLLLLAFLATFLSMAVASLTLQLLREWSVIKGKAQSQESQALSRWNRFDRLKRYHWLGSLVIVLPATVLLLSRNFPFDSWYDAIFYGIYMGSCALGGTLIGYIRFMGHHRFFHHGLLVAFAAAIFGALSLSALELPNLPLVEIEATTEWPQELAGSPFRLLSNDAQHWYVYNHESGMLAMDQADVKSVRFWDDTQERTPDVSTQDGRVNPD
jgi:hypothetical protein